MPIRPYAPQPFPDFAKEIQGAFAGFWADNPEIAKSYGIRFREDPKSNHMIVEVMSREGSKQVQNPNRRREDLSFTLAPGPITAFGHGNQVEGDTGHAIQLINSEKGSRYSRLFGAELFVPGNARGAHSIEARTPLQSLLGYVGATLREGPTFSGGLRSRFSQLLSLGEEEIGLAGGLLQVGPQDTPRSIWEKANRVTVSYGSQEPGLVSKANEWINNMIQNRRDPSPFTHVLSKMSGWSLYRSEDERNRLRMIGTTYINSQGQVVTDIDKQGQIDILGENPAKALKGINVIESEREKIQQPFYRVEEAGRKLVPQAALPILPTDTDTSGYRMLNLSTHGAGAERAMVYSNVAMVKETPFPGSLIQQESPLPRNVIGPFYPKTYQREVFAGSIDQLAQSKIRWGIMQQTTNKAGEIVYRKTRGIAGYPIAPGENPIIGTIQVPDENGRLLPAQPIQLGSSNLNRVISNETPRLIVPRAFETATGYPANLETDEFAEPDMPPAERISAAMKARIRRAAPGTSVEATGTNAYWLSVGYGEEVGMSIKDMANKAGIVQSDRPIDFEPNTSVTVAGQSVNISAVAAVNKNPMLGWWGSFGSMNVTKQVQLLSDIYGKGANVTKYYQGILSRQIAIANKYNQDREAIAASGEWVVPDEWEMTQTMGGGSPIRAINDMYQRYLKLEKRRPKYVMQNFGMGVSERAQPLRVGTVTEGTMAAWQGLTEATVDKMEDITAEQKAFLKKQLFEYRETNLPGTRDMYINQPFRIGRMTGAPIAEFMTKDIVRLSPDELLSDEALIPEIRKIIGSGSTPPSVQAWNSAAKLYMYQFPKTPGTIVPSPDTATEITESQRTSIASGLIDVGPNASAAQMEEVISGVLGKEHKSILYMPETQSMMLTPAAQHAMGETQIGPEGEDIPVGRIEKNIYPTLMGFMTGGTYKDNKAMMDFRNTLYTAFGENFANRSKGLLGTFDPASMGGRFSGHTGAGVASLGISDAQMRRLLRGVAERSGIDPRMKVGKQTWLQASLEQVNKVGGMPVALDRIPNVMREGGTQVLMAVTPTILRARGMDEKPGTEFGKGKVTVGSRTNWGILGRLGPGFGRTLGDFDFDPANFISLLTASNKGVNAQEVADQFAEILNATPEQWTRNYLEKNALIESNAQKTANSQLKALEDMASSLLNPKSFFGKKSIAQATAGEISAAGTNLVESKMRMGESYNVRRFFEAAMEGAGFQDKTIAGLHSISGLSYQMHVDLDSEKRWTQRFMASISPYVESKGVDAPHIGLQMLSPTAKEGGFGRYGNNFDSARLVEDVQLGLVKDIRQHFINPGEAVGLLSEANEAGEKDLLQNLERLKQGEDPYKILNEITGREGFKFSNTVFGKMIMGSLLGKLEGLKGNQYLIPDTSFDYEARGKVALDYMNKSELVVGGQKRTLGNLVEDLAMRTTRLVYKLDTGKGGITRADELATLAQGIQDQERRGIHVGAKTRYFAEKMGVNEALQSVAATRSVEAIRSRNTIDLSNIAVTPSAVPTLAFKGKYLGETMRGLVAEQFLGIHDMGLYDPAGKRRLLANVAPGNEFHKDAYRIAQELGWQDIARPGTRLDAVTKFGRMTGEIDVGGINPEDDNLYLPDLKFSSTQELAEGKVSDPTKVRPQVVTYHEMLRSLAHTKIGGETDEAYERRLGVKSEREFFQRSTQGLFLPERLRGANLRPDDPNYVSSMESAGRWFDRLREGKVRIGAIAAYSGKHGGREYVGGKVFNEFEGVKEGEVETLAGAVQQTLEEELTPEKIKSHITEIRGGLQRSGGWAKIPEETRRLINEAIENPDTAIARFQTQHISPEPLPQVETPSVAQIVSSPAARIPRSANLGQSSPPVEKLPVGSRLSQPAPQSQQGLGSSSFLPPFMMNDARFNGGISGPPGGRNTPVGDFRGLDPNGEMRWIDWRNSVSYTDYWETTREELGYGSSNKGPQGRGAGTGRRSGGKGKWWEDVPYDTDKFEAVKSASHEFDLLARVLEKDKEAIEEHAKAVGNNKKAMSDHTVEIDKAIAGAKSDVATNDLKLTQIRAAIKLAESGGEVEGRVISKDELQLGYAARDKLIQKGRGFRAALKETEETGAETFGQDLRKVFGGFGLFYLGTLMKMGMGSWQQGAQELQGYQQQTTASAIGMYGTGGISAYANPEYAARASSIRSGGGMYGYLQRLGSQIGGFSDITGSLLTGVGTALAANYAAPAFASLIPGLSEWLGGAGGPILGGLAMGGSFVATQIANAENRDQTLMQSAALQASGGIGPLMSEMKSIGPYVSDIFSGRLSETRNIFGGHGTQFAELRDVLSSQVKGVETGGFSVKDLQRMTPREKLLFAQALGASNIQGLEGLSSETKASLTMMLSTGKVEGYTPALGYSPVTTSLKEMLETLGPAMEAGIPVAELSAAIRGVSGGAAETQYDTFNRAINIAKMSDYDRSVLQSGLDLMTRTPGIQKMMHGKTEEEIKEEAKLYAEVSGGRWEEKWLERANLKKERAAYGLETKLDIRDFARTSEFDIDEFNKIQALENRGVNLAQVFAGAGLAGYQKIIRQIETRGIGEMRFAERATSFSPTAIGELAQSIGGVQGAELSKYAVTDFNLYGQQTGLGLWTTSLNQGTIGAVSNANKIWGRGNWESNPWAQAMTYGYNKRTGQTYGSEAERQMDIYNGASPTDIVGGIRGAEWRQLNERQALSQQQLGIQAAQVALQEKYQPLFWNLEDRSRALSRQQTEWGFSQQEASMAMQVRQFQESTALQAREMAVNRGWAQEQWGYQDTTRALQWGWKQEDFAEQSRFMTGRQRRLAERGMERDTVMHNLESDQIEKQRAHQKELWALEDERFALQKKQFAEQKQFQEESLARQKQFYEEGKKLEDEQVALSRQYAKEQLALQKASIGIQQKQLELNNQYEKTMMDVRTTQDDVIAGFKLASEMQTELLKLILEALGGRYEPTSGGGSGGKNLEKMEAEGGDIRASQTTIVGERGPEVLRQGIIGSVVNQYDIAASIGSQDRWSSRSVFYPSTRGINGSNGAGQTLNVYIGNERLASFVIDTVRKDMEVL